MKEHIFIDVRTLQIYLDFCKQKGSKVSDFIEKLFQKRLSYKEKFLSFIQEFVRLKGTSYITDTKVEPLSETVLLTSLRDKTQILTNPAFLDGLKYEISARYSCKVGFYNVVRYLKVETEDSVFYVRNEVDSIIREKCQKIFVCYEEDFAKVSERIEIPILTHSFNDCSKVSVEYIILQKYTREGFFDFAPPKQFKLVETVPQESDFADLQTFIEDFARFITDNKLKDYFNG